MTERILPATASLRSRWGSAVGLRCDLSPGVVGMVFVSDWREVDAAIEAVSAVLAEGELGETVDIQVSGVPVAD